MSSGRPPRPRDMSLPDVVNREEWLAARNRLLVREKQLTRARDALSSERRRLPMVAVDKDYVLHGPQGEVGLADLFEGRAQLIVRHFMFDPSWEDGCSSCTAAADEVSPGLIEHLAARETTLAHVALAPLDKIERYAARRGWTFAFYSSSGSDFNEDFGVTVEGQEIPATSCFLRVGERVFHTYSTFARGGEWTGGSYAFLDLTALGRQEDWEEPRGRAASVHGARPDFAT